MPAMLLHSTLMVVVKENLFVVMVAMASSVLVKRTGAGPASPLPCAFPVARKSVHSWNIFLSDDLILFLSL